jgi:hypothetical protein
MKVIIIVLALLAAVPASAQVPCSIRQEPVAEAMILHRDDDTYDVRDVSCLCGTSICSIAEFSPVDMLRDAQQVKLVLNIGGDPNSTINGQIRVNVFAGDGVVTEEDFWAGSLYAAVTIYEQEYDMHIEFDVTPLFYDIELLATGILGFRLGSLYEYYDLRAVYLCYDDGTPVEAVTWGLVKGLHR